MSFIATTSEVTLAHPAHVPQKKKSPVGATTTVDAAKRLSTSDSKMKSNNLPSAASADQIQTDNQEVMVPADILRQALAEASETLAPDGCEETEAPTVDADGATLLTNESTVQFTTEGNDRRVVFVTQFAIVIPQNKFMQLHASLLTHWQIHSIRIDTLDCVADRIPEFRALVICGLFLLDPSRIIPRGFVPGSVGLNDEGTWLLLLQEMGNK